MPTWSTPGASGAIGRPAYRPASAARPSRCASHASSAPAPSAPCAEPCLERAGERAWGYEPRREPDGEQRQRRIPVVAVADRIEKQTDERGLRGHEPDRGRRATDSPRQRAAGGDDDGGFGESHRPRERVTEA